MTAASNSEGRKRAQEAARSAETGLGATNGPSVGPGDLDAIRARAEAATPGRWHWAGNTDTGEPYLATWTRGIGRCSVMAIGNEDRKTTGREADRVRSDAEEYSLGDPEELVEKWATDGFGEPIKDPRLWFYTDLMADPARDHVIYEVAPGAATRDDPKVYRADITGIRHPDAEFIAAARTDIPALLAALDEARAEAERYRGMFERCLESENRAQADLAVAEARAVALEATLATVRAEHTRDRERLAKVEALVEHSESRVDIAHRLVTTDAIRAALAPEVDCVHCGDAVINVSGHWAHAYRTADGVLRQGKARCQSPSVAYGHLAHPAGVPCEADGPNPCLGAALATTSEEGLDAQR